jgi:hypothetical protein
VHLHSHTSNYFQKVWDINDLSAAVDDATCPDGSPCGRPLYPSLFITDITADPNDRSGDWQYGGSPITPIKMCGNWKGVTKVINGATCPTGTSSQGNLCTEEDPTANQAGKNSWYLGAGTLLLSFFFSIFSNSSTYLYSRL